MTASNAPHSRTPAATDTQLARKAEQERRARLLDEIEAIEQALLDDPAHPPRPALRHPAPPPPAAVATPEATPSRPAAGLLDRLRAEAQAARADAAPQPPARPGDADFDRALREVFSYCDDLARQLNVLQPGIGREYYLLGDLVFRALRWEHGRTDYRTLAHTEQQLIRQVSFSWRLSGPQPLGCEREGPGIERLRTLLGENGVHFECKEIRNATRRVERAVFTIPAALPCGTRWEADPERGVLKLTSVNVDRFSVLTHSVPLDAINRPLLDDFGAFVLGLPNTFLSRLQRG